MERTENRIRALRDSAAEDVLRRIRRDGEAAHPRFRVLLAAIGRRLFDPDFGVSTLWKETGVDAHHHVWFRELDEPTTPRDYIAARRLDTAAEMLIRDPYGFKVWRIAEAVCYEQGTFSVAFKRRFGVSPSEYKERHGGRTGMAIRNADEAFLAGFPAAALDHLADADVTDPRVAARLGLARHGYACVELKEGRIDDAYEHLGLAQQHYSAAGELPAFVARHRALTYVSCNTDHALLDALCRSCREHLLGDVGAPLQRHLRDALVLVPTDLDWFQVCCDNCHGVIWKAFDFARHAFLPDAYHAWWLAEYADLDDPHSYRSVGRVIAALATVEGMQYQDQKKRFTFAELALMEATALGQPLLVTAALFWRGNVWRARSRFSEAREDLKLTRPLENPWLLALHQRFSGLLEQATNNSPAALDLLMRSARGYMTLDPHTAGKLLLTVGVEHSRMKHYEKAIDFYRQASGILDARREPLVARAALPIDLAVTTTLLGNPARARAELARCSFDRERYPSVAANEIHTLARIAQFEGNHREAAALLGDVRRRFELLDKHLYAALVANDAVESHSELGEHQEAIRCCVTAARFFEAAGCPLDTLEAVARLEALLRSRAKPRAVAASVRLLARRHGGWLPDP